jgi:hypothetical protein
MYILVARDLSALIKTLLAATGQSGLELEQERFLTPLFAARATKSQQAALVILQEVARAHQYPSELVELCQRFSEEKPKSSEWNTRFKQRTKKQRELGPLWYVALDTRDDALAAFLLSLDRLTRPADNLDQGFKGGRAPLRLAAELGAVTTAKLLFEEWREGRRNGRTR